MVPNTSVTYLKSLAHNAERGLTPGDFRFYYSGTTRSPPISLWS